MKRIFIINVPQVGTYDLLTIELYTIGEILPTGENQNIDYAALTAEQQTVIDDIVNLLFNNLPA